MAMLEYVEKSDRYFRLENPQQIKEDWEISTLLWWGKYCAADRDMFDACKMLYGGKLARAFVLDWRTRPRLSFILWSFPMHDPTMLAIKAFRCENGWFKRVTLIDASAGVNILDDGGDEDADSPNSPAAFITDEPKAPESAVLVTHASVPVNAKIVKELDRAPLDSAARRVSSSLQNLLIAAKRAQT